MNTSRGNWINQQALGLAGTWLRIVVSFVLVSSGAVVYLLLSLLLLPWRPLRIRIGNVYGKILGPSVTRILGIRTRVRHRERLSGSSPAIYITNHTSILDVLIAMWLCPMGGCGIAKREIARIPFFGLGLLAVWTLAHRSRRPGGRHRGPGRDRGVRSQAPSEHLDLARGHP